MVVDIREHSRGETHAVGSDVGPGCRAVGLQTYKLEVFSSIGRMIDAHHLITGHRLSLSIVGQAVVVTSDGHHHIVRQDGQMAVRHVEGHIEVVVVVAEFTIESHVEGTHQSGRHRTVGFGTVVSVVRSSIHRIADGHIIAGHLFRGVVEEDRIHMTLNRHRHLTRSYLLVTVLSNDESH